MIRAIRTGARNGRVHGIGSALGLVWFLGLATGLATACFSDGRRALIVYSPHGRDLLAHYERAFEAAHPDVDVQWMDMGSQEILDRAARSLDLDVHP